MALKFQYNKTALRDIEKQLNIRVRALPTLKNKESALRVEVKKAKKMADTLEELIESRMEDFKNYNGLWCEFDPTLIKVVEILTSSTKIAGVKIIVFDDVVFKQKTYNFMAMPVWFFEGINYIKDIVKLKIRKDYAVNMMHMLESARRKTTQKVNLYEKVQIPEYQTAIRKIKRFLEDEENLSKAAQKIIKKRKIEIVEA
ncbi:MAG: V-type ATP synthase subunit D [Bacteroidales bacterium]|nr:V-type ATP synthase subunit D [Bacteroidales bacterium]